MLIVNSIEKYNINGENMVLIHLDAEDKLMVGDNIICDGEKVKVKKIIMTHDPKKIQDVTITI